MEFSEARDKLKLIKTALRKSINELGAQRALIILPESDDEFRPAPLAQIGFENPRIWESPEVQADALRLVLLSGETFQTADVRGQGRFSSQTCGRSILCFAVGRGGAVYCDHDDPDVFGHDEVVAAEAMAREFNQRLRELTEAETEAETDTPRYAAPEKTSRREPLAADEVVLSLRDRHLFTMQLATLISAGVSLGNSLHALSRTPDPKVAAVGEALAYQVETGNYLSQGMRQMPLAFDELYVGLIAIAEETGNVGPVMKATAEKLERTLQQQAKVIEACTYPLCVAGFSMGVAFLLATYMLPQLLGVLEGLEMEMPLLTKIMMAVVNSGILYQGLILALLGGAALYWRRHSPGVKNAFNRLSYQLPGIGRINRFMTLGRWCRDQALMLETGFGIVSALRKIGETGTGLAELDEATLRLEARIAEGVEFAEAINDEWILPPLVRSALELGETSGRLDQFLTVAANHLEAEADRAVERITALIEPITIGLLGLLVGAVVLAAFLPIYQLLSSTL